MAEERKTARHRVMLEDRERCNIAGVTDVVSFDEECVIAETDCGTIVVKGRELRVSSLSVDSGNIDIDGEIDGVTYDNPGKSRGSLFGRVFK
jgi:sporulation protein YabP